MDVAVSSLGQYFRRSLILFLSIDPGRFKFGWVFVSFQGELLLSGIEKTENLDFFFNIIAEGLFYELDGRFLEGKLKRVSKKKVSLTFLGDGTGKDAFLFLEKIGIKIRLINESGTTLEARKIFWKLHPPKGWRRLVSLNFQIPPRDVDDLAAYEIALRGIRELKMEEI